MFRACAVPWIASLVSIICVMLILPGCSNQSAPRSTIVVESVNNNGFLNSDVYSLGADEQMGTADDNIPEEAVPIIVRNDPQDASLNVHPNGAFSTVTIERYEVRYSGDADLPTFSAATHLVVPTGSTVTGSLVLLPASYKIAPPLDVLVNGGEIHLNADVVLFGVEADSDTRTTTHASISINVANWADK